MAAALLRNRIEQAKPGALRSEIAPQHPYPCLRRHVSRGESLCSAGETFRALYIVYVGNLKSCVVSRNGLIQVTVQ